MPSSLALSAVTKVLRSILFGKKSLGLVSLFGFGFGFGVGFVCGFLPGQGSE